MTDNSDANTWSSKQTIWIKDVLSKSGTELMKITKSVSNAGNKISKKSNDKDPPIKMVYYQSTPLIIKTEQPSQTQLCMQTLQTSRTTPPSPPTPHATSSAMPPHTNEHSVSTQNYNLNNVALNMHQQQQHQLQEIPATQHQQHQQSTTNLTYLSNIKTELLPPSISVYSGAGVPFQTSTNGSTQQPTIPATPTTNTANGNRKTPTSKPQFKCEQCGMTFGSKSAHTSHTKSHVKNGDYNLNASSQLPAAVEVNEAGIPLGIPKTPQIKPNANAANGGDPYQCNVCQKTFAVPARLIRHYRTHTGERPFECEFCHKLFSVKENLQVHRRIHTKERPYKCDVCGRAFEHSGKLHRHMRIHTGERPHKCSVCDKTFIQSGQLVIHMRTHTGEKPYKCPVEGCGKGFTCSKQLKVHSRTHTGEKPYHCDICFRDFGYNHVLKLHRVQHYGSKCYKCTICDETFKSKKEMEAHIKGHANEMPDDEEGETGANGSGDGSVASNSVASATPPSTIATSSGTESTTPPNSPHSPSSNQPAKASKAKKPRQKAQRVTANSNGNSNGIGAMTTTSLSPMSPESVSSAYSPSNSSFASASRLSVASPTSSASIASPPMPIQHETDHHSRDSGVASASTSVHYAPQHHSQQPITYMYDEMPTDLRVPQQQTLQQQAASYYQPQAGAAQAHAVPLYAYARDENLPEQSSQHQMLNSEAPTINSVLLEAASIASRSIDCERSEEDVRQAALQIMQLNRSQPQKPSNYTTLTTATNLTQSLVQPQHQPHHQHHAALLDSALAHYDDTHEANELIDHYKRGDLAKHVQKGYAPVPPVQKFESSLHNNDILVRKLEAALAPLRSSTESPDRSSSPESDSMLMADRDVMTLPLRKRKVYMSNDPNGVVLENGGIGNAEGANGNGTSNTNSEINNKVMRMSSVIQFAKAS